MMTQMETSPAKKKRKQFEVEETEDVTHKLAYDLEQK